MNKRKALYLLKEFGDAVIDFHDKTPSMCCTTDFSNKYIRRIRRTEKFNLKGCILLFDWTNNKFNAIPSNNIKNITSLSAILRNKRHG